MFILRLDQIETKRSFIGGLLTAAIQYFAKNMQLEVIVLSVMTVMLMIDTAWGTYGAIVNHSFNGKRFIKGVFEKLIMYFSLIMVAHLSSVMAHHLHAPVLQFLAPFIYGTMFVYEAQSVLRNIAKTKKDSGRLLRRILKYFHDFDEKGNPKNQDNA